MQKRLIALVVGLGCGPVPPASVGVQPAPLRRPQGGAATALTPHDSALHALNRLAYGPRPGEVDRVAAGSVMRWIDRQLDPDEIADQVLVERERAFEVLTRSRGELAQQYFNADRERRERQRAGSAGDGNGMADSMRMQDTPGPEELAARRLTGQFVALTVMRAALSERQLREVVVDFWSNHFNVFLGKGADRFLLPDYIEHTIRPHALGKFADLLIATAESPAMLFYLDNWQSVAPGSLPPGLRRASWPGRFGPGFTPDALRAEGRRRQALDHLPQGINENYARELLELHTLGVDGGYTQQDVINVARIFTGWSIERPQLGGGFAYHDWAHDRGAKVVMGIRYPAGHGMDEGIRLLRWLANHPATIHHVSRELCQRFVSDEPPDGCVDDAVAAWMQSGGDLRAVLSAIVHGPDFWAPANVRAKVKTPFVFVVSALRAVGAAPDTTPRLAQVIARLGEPLYMHVAPDGYPQTEDEWVNSGALLDRMNSGLALASGRLPGTLVDVDSVIPTNTDPVQLIAAVNATILGGTMTANTKRVILEQLADVADPARARALAVGLAVGGPEFQRQ